MEPVPDVALAGSSGAVRVHVHHGPGESGRGLNEFCSCTVMVFILNIFILNNFIYLPICFEEIGTIYKIVK